MKWKMLLVYAGTFLSPLVFFAYQWNAIQNVPVSEARYPPDITDENAYSLPLDMNAEDIVRRLFDETASEETARLSKAMNISMKKVGLSSGFKFRLLALAMRADGMVIAVVNARGNNGVVLVKSYIEGDLLPNGARILHISKNFLKYKNETTIKILWLFNKGK